jgi:hypothetical protein
MNLRSLLAAAAFSAGAFVLSTQAASAMPAAPVEEALATHIEKTYGGCGFNGHRGPWGGCRFGGQNQVWRARRYYGWRRW